MKRQHMTEKLRQRATVALVRGGFTLPEVEAVLGPDAMRLAWLEQLRDDERHDLLATRSSELWARSTMGRRPRKAIEESGLLTVGELATRTFAQWNRVPGVGPRLAREIVLAVEDFLAMPRFHE